MPSCAAPRGRTTAARCGVRCCGRGPIENQCYLAGVNRVGTDPDASYAGDSALVDFRGATLADAGEREQTLVAEFDSEAQAAFREEFPAWMDADGFELEF